MASNLDRFKGNIKPENTYDSIMKETDKTEDKEAKVVEKLGKNSSNQKVTVKLPDETKVNLDAIQLLIGNKYTYETIDHLIDKFILSLEREERKMLQTIKDFKSTLNRNS